MNIGIIKSSCEKGNLKNLWSLIFIIYFNYMVFLEIKNKKFNLYEWNENYIYKYW